MSEEQFRAELITELRGIREQLAQIAGSARYLNPSYDDSGIDWEELREWERTVLPHMNVGDSADKDPDTGIWIIKRKEAS